MGDDLQDKPRKELKELCSRNNIRTAGVKHEDLVRLLRNKLYPSAPSTPRSTSLNRTRGGGPKEPSPVKDTNAADSYRTPVKSKARNPRTPSTLPCENEKSKEFQRKNPGLLSRKPLLTKSSTFAARTRGAGQERSHARPVKGLSPLSRRSGEKAMSSTQSESRHLEDDSGSDASRRVSEVATDAGPDTMSDFSDADEFRSVASEPASARLGKRASSSTLRTEASLMSAQSGLSFFTAGSWGSEHSRGLESLLRGEDVFPELPGGEDFLGDALEVSFLDAGAADPEVVGFIAMHSPMARDYVNYHRGSEAEGLKSLEDGKRPGDLEFGGESKDLDLAPGASGDMAKEDCEDDHLVKSADVERWAVDTPTQGEPCAREDGAVQPKSLFPSKSDLAPGASGDTGKEDGKGDHQVEYAGAEKWAADTSTQCEPCACEDAVIQPTPEDEGHSGLREGEESGSPRNMHLGDGEDLVPSKNDLAPGASDTMEDCEDDHQGKSAGVEGWTVDTPTQGEPCAREDGAVTQPTPEDEVHSGVPEGEESDSPAFDYSVAKKLEFEPVEITSVPSAERCNVEGDESQKIVPAETVDPSDSTPTNAEEPTEEPGCSVDEREGANVKSGNDQCDNDKPLQNGSEKEDVQATLPFPLSVILWCSQLCSSTFGRRTRTLTS